MSEQIPVPHIPHLPCERTFEVPVPLRGGEVAVLSKTTKRWLYEGRLERVLPVTQEGIARGIVNLSMRKSTHLCLLDTFVALMDHNQMKPLFFLEIL